MIPAVKICTCCRTEKSSEHFYKRRRGTGLVPRCIECTKLRVTEWRNKYPDRYRALFERNYKRRDRIRRRMHKDILGPPERCAICGMKFIAQDKQTGPQYDHNHGTGAARGWLCGPCNMGLGSFRDNPALLKAAVGYLQARGFHAEKPRIA